MKTLYDSYEENLVVKKNPSPVKSKELIMSEFQLEVLKLSMDEKFQLMAEDDFIKVFAEMIIQTLKFKKTYSVAQPIIPGDGYDSN